MDYIDAQIVARQQMLKYGLGNWVLQFDRAKRRAGLCQHRRQTISLSVNFIKRNDHIVVLDTILHEIAHALVGPGKGHGYEWKRMCIQVGAKPIRCYGEHVDMPKGQWQATCNGCSLKFYRHRKPKHINGLYCTKCGPVVGLLKWSNHEYANY